MVDKTRHQIPTILRVCVKNLLVIFRCDHFFCSFTFLFSSDRVLTAARRCLRPIEARLIQGSVRLLDSDMSQLPACVVDVGTGYVSLLLALLRKFLWSVEAAAGGR